MRLAYHICLIFLFIYPSALRAQESAYADQLEALIAEMDSLSIFSLIDSTLSASYTPYSELNIRASYSSNVAVAGRNYGINQHGFSPGISFYHKSGLFADVTGYWNSAYEPAYSVTMLSLGYFGNKGNFTFVPSYERWIYNMDETATLFNNLGISMSQKIKFLSLGVDYSFMFGAETAHRLIPTMSGYFSIKDVWFFDAITFMPTASLLFGNDEITTQRFTEDKVVRLTDQSLYYLSQQTYNDQKAWLLIALNRIRKSALSNKEKRIRIERLSELNNNLETYGSILSPEELSQIEDDLIVENKDNVFGLMNLNLSFPIFFTIDQLSIALTYSYNIPYSLPGEDFSFDPISYISASVTYRIPFKN
ncbi:MAG: hypothetical protein RIA62_05590 [Cyclobacteriaceae bacterium]